MKTYFEIMKEWEEKEDILSENGVLKVLYKYQGIKELVENWDCKDINTINVCKGKEFYSNIVKGFKILNDIEVKISERLDKGNSVTSLDKNKLISNLSIIQEMNKDSTTINDKKAKNEIDLEVCFIMAKELELLYHLQYDIRKLDYCFEDDSLKKLIEDVIQYFYKSIGVNIDNDLVYKIQNDESKPQVDIKDVVMSLITEAYNH